MMEGNERLLSPSLSDDSTLQQELFETEAPEFDHLFAPSMDDVDLDHQVFPWQGDLLQDMNHHDAMPEQIAEFSRLVDFPVPPAQFCNEIPTNKEVLSSEEILKLAGIQYMRASANGGYDYAAYCAIPALPTEEQNGRVLAHLLLSSADMISNQQYDQAARLLSQCKNFSSQLGNPIQRLAYYFSEALQERIVGESLGEMKKPPKRALNFAYNVDSDFDKKELYALVAFYTRALPYAKVLQFTSVQAIIDAAGNEENIHVIDLGIRTGSQWTVLIQFLADAASCNSSSLELLKITAVGMNGEDLQNSGRRLCEFARSLAVPFSYRMVKISNMEEIHKGLFKVKSGEAVAVYAPTVLRSLLYDPLLLDKLMRGIKKLNPRIVVNEEVEGQHNSPSFLNRFIEVLFYHSTHFDSLEVILPDRNDVRRAKCEEVFYGYQIRNMITCEGKDRKVRHVTSNVWSCFFRQAGFKAMSFTYKAWYQARLVLDEFPHGKCYTLEPNGRAIVVGWKGTPLYALSVWGCN